MFNVRTLKHMDKLPLFLEYLRWMNKTDEGLCGIRYDAPKEIKEYYKRLKELEKQGYK
jgi:hypothetical protein